MIRCIVFDFDGTLVVSNHIKRQAFFEVVRSHDPSGMTVTRILQNYPNKDRDGIFLEIARELFTQNPTRTHQNPEPLATQWAKTYTLHCEQAIATCEEVSGASETLQWIAQQHIPMFMNSRTPTTTLVRLVMSRSLNRYMSNIYGAPATKSENLEKIQKQTQAHSHEILFVGDSEDDRKAALEGGYHFVGVVLGKEVRFSHPHPELQIANLYQLQKVVTTLHAKDRVA